MSIFDKEDCQNKEPDINNDDVNVTSNSDNDTVNNIAPEAQSEENQEKSIYKNDEKKVDGYEYGISYSSSHKGESLNFYKSIDATSKAKKNKGSHRVIFTASIICLALALNFCSVFVGIKLTVEKYKKELQAVSESIEANSSNNANVTVYQSVPDISKVNMISGSAAGSTLSKKEVWSLVKDSVVEIQTETIVNGNRFGQYVSSGAGSGVIVGFDQANGEYYVITNNHVIDGASTITVRLTNGNEFNALLVGTDATSDIAVVKIKSEDTLTLAKFGLSSNLAVGEDVIAIGNPLGELGGTTTDGIISALERDVVIDGIVMKLLQTNAAVNPGNSGGGLFNMAGELIGVVNAKYSDEDVEGLAFAIPSDTANDIMSQLINHGYVKGRPALGITVSERTQTYFGTVYNTYVLVTDPGNNSDIKVNDQIYAIDNMEISSFSDIKSIIQNKEIGDIVKVTVYRNRTLIDVNVTIVEYVPSEGSVEFTPDA